MADDRRSANAGPRHRHTWKYNANTAANADANARRAHGKFDARLPTLIIFLLLSLTNVLGLKMESDPHGPIFITEPPSHVDFSNFTGARIECVAHGNPPPVVRWTHSDGASVVDVPGLRHALRNGTLHFQPFRGDEYKSSVHAGVYKCTASNPTGTIVSPDVNVRAVVNQYFEVQVYDEFVILGNTAVLKCHIPSFVRDYVVVTSWIRVEGSNIYSTVVPDGRFIQTSAGDLYVQNVDAADGSVSFRCETLHRLTGESRLSTPGKIVVTDPKSSVTPRMTHSMSVVNAKQGDLVQLPCAAQGYPMPSHRWYRVKGQDLLPAEDGGRIRQLSGFLLLERVQSEDAGIYRCVVRNSVGEERAETVLRLRVPLSAHVQPQHQVVDVGKPATFTCSASGHPVVQVTWLHNGRPLEIGDRVRLLTQWVLQIERVEKEDRGMYQCFVQNAEETVQGTAELRLGDVVPTMVSTFSSKTFQQGAFVSLKCVASGHPPPHFTWTLDEVALPSNRRFKSGEFADVNGDVTSYVNVSSARVEDGGHFRCRATNKAGKVDYVARLNVFGPPHIRPIPNAFAIAGSNVTVTCHVSGYPIESIKWERDGNVLPFNRRQQVFENGTCIIRNLDRTSDEGVYTCVARGPRGESARRQVTIKVQVAPLIEPFSFPRVVQEGTRARLTCVVTQGDLPITITWIKDGNRITSDQDVTIRQDDDFSSSLTFPTIRPHQKGAYSCIAKNAVAMANHTAALVVDVPPRWVVQPIDQAVLFRDSLVLDCKADGHPVPTITWKKGVGKQLGNFRDMNFSFSQHRTFANGSLLLQNVAETDEGYYLCEASNGVGAGLSKVVYLTVHAVAHFDQKYVNRSLRRGEDGSLNCRARGDAPIQILWSINGQKLDKQENGRFKWESQDLPDSVESSLIIPKVDREDAQVYTCYASNAYGRDETQISVVVEEPPEVPDNVRIIDRGSRTVSLAWNSPFDGHSPLLRYIVQYKRSSDEWQSVMPNRTVTQEHTNAVLNALQPGWSYAFRVIAENAVGFSEPSGIVAVTTSEEAPEGPPLHVEAKALGPEAVKIAWKAPKAEHQNGDILGYYVGYRVYDGSEPYVYQTTKADKQTPTGEIVLKNLRKFTKYSVLVQAFNNVGSGPHSEETIVFTSEDVPSGAPQNVICSTLDSTSLLVTWDPPTVSLQNGLIQGYKVYYHIPPEFGGSLQDGDHFVTAPSSSQRASLYQLEKFTNYSVQVLAYTRMGDGVKSGPRYCRTKEDVPGPPGDIKALSMSADSILLSWSHPSKPNGLVTKYNVYMRALDKGEQQAKKYSFPARTQLWHEVRGLSENQRYEFWVTASTSIGEGESTTVVTQAPLAKVSARIASFPQKTVALWKTEVILPCLTVGIPEPSREWKFREKLLTDSDKYRVLSNGSLLIRSSRRVDAGHYTCRVENVYGFDEIVQELMVFAPPMPPHVSVLQTISNSVELLLKPVTTEDASPIQGYVVKYKRDFGGWEEVDVKGDETVVTLPDLHCGTRYQIEVAAFNDVGVGDHSMTITTSTKGAVPQVPSQESVLKVNITTLSIRLAGWPDGGCPVRHFVIQYRPRHQKDFVLVSNNVPNRQEAFLIPELIPGIIYHLHITAHNDAGSTVAEYEFATNGNNIAGNMQADSGERPVPFYKDVSIAVPLFSSAVTLVIVVVALCFFLKRRKYSRYQHSVTSSTQNDYPDSKSRELQEKEAHADNLIGCNFEPTYVPSPIRKSSQFLQHPEDPTDYPADVYPYATFRLPGCKEQEADLHSVQLRTFSDSGTVRRYPPRCQVDNHRADMQFMEQQEKDFMQCHLDEKNLRDEDLPYLHQYISNEDMPMLKSSNAVWSSSGGRYSPLGYEGGDKHPVHYPNLNHMTESPTQLFEQTQVPDLLYHGMDSTSNENSPEEKLRDYGSNGRGKKSPGSYNKNGKKYSLPSPCDIHLEVR